jgi:hypothetical protein
MKMSSFKSDMTKVEGGVWIGDIPDMGDLRLKVRPIGNPDYLRVLSQLTDTAPRHTKRGGRIIDHAVKASIAARTLADTVLLDWEGLEDDDGKPLPYSAEIAKKMLLDPEYVAFRNAVSWAGSVAEEETTGVQEDKAKN